MTTEIHYLELTEIGRRMHAKEISPVEVTKAMLARIEAIDPTLHSYFLVTSELALAQARKAEAEIHKGEIKGPLHGVPVAVKDVFWTKDIVTTAGMMVIHRDFRPDRDATVVRKLREAGAVLLGKLTTTEGAYADHHRDVPWPVNPWNAAHWVGASSSGSGVATAAGLCYGSLASDTGGSIRLPAAATGLTGIKPTYGRVSRHGAFASAPTMDHIGLMTRSAGDAAAMLGAIAGADENDPTACLEPVPNYFAGIKRGLRGVRIGIDPDFIAGEVDEVTTSAVNAVIKTVAELGGDMRTIRFPDPTQLVADWFDLVGIETSVVHEATYASHKAEYGPALANMIEAGRKASAMEYEHIILRRNDYRGRYLALFEAVDLIVLPIQPAASPTVATMTGHGHNPKIASDVVWFNCCSNMAGNPTITLPCGFTSAGTPVAFQFVAAPMNEALLCRAAFAYQEATDWHRRHPTI